MRDHLHIYLRVSTETQSVDGFGLETQEEYGRDVSRKLGLEPMIWNEGSASSSNDNLDKRPVLLDLLDHIEKGEVKHLYVFNTDRLSRNTQTFGLIRYKISQNSVLLYQGANPQPSDLSDDQQNLLFGMMGEIAQYENNLRRKRLVSGKIKKIKGGGWRGGPTPFGYHNVDGKLKPHPQEKKWVKLIFEEYSIGRSVNDIRTILLENGVRTRRGNPSWSLGSIRCVLTNTHYSGSYTFTDKASGEVIVCRCDPIIPTGLYKKVSKTFAERSYNAKGRVREGQQKHNYLVKEFLRCGHCGGLFGARRNKIQYYNHYYCRGNENSWIKGSKKNKCKDRVRSIDIDQADTMVWDAILDVLSKSHLFKETVKSEVMGRYKTHTNSEEEIKSTKKKIRRLKKEIEENRIITSSTEASGLLRKKSEVEVKQILSVLEQDRLDKAERLEELQKSLISISGQSEWIDWVREFGNRIESWKSEEFDFDQKKTLINQFVKSIVVESEDKISHRLKINFNVPYVNDKFKWKFKKDKSGKSIKDGYDLMDGSNQFLTKSVYRTKNSLKKARITNG